MLKKLLTGENASLTRYIEESKRFPILAPDVERDLAIAWRERGSPQALEQLVGSHLRLVIKIARGFGGYGLPLVDLVAEGNVGLMQAAQKFDPQRGFRFATYATWWIRAAIQEYILHSWSLVKMGTTAAQKKLFFSLGRLKRKLGEYGSGDLQPDSVTSIANDLSVPEEDVVAMNRRLSGPVASLNAPMSADGDSGEWQDLLADERPSVEESLVERGEARQRSALLHEAMGVLNDRERDILTSRRLSDSPLTLEDLSVRYGVSRERIRQIEEKAFEKVARQTRVLAAAVAA